MILSTGDMLLAANVIPLAFNLILSLAAIGAPLAAVASEIGAAASKKVFYKKFGQQISAMGLYFTLYMLLVIVGSVALIKVKIPGMETFLSDGMQPLKWLAAPFGIWIVALLIYTTTWKKLKNSKAVHILVGLFTALGALASAYGMAALGRAYLFPARDRAPFEPLTVYLPHDAVAFWPILAWAFLLALGCAGALGLGFLLYRRNRDDWGRDYYNHSLKYCAKWALIPTVLQFAPLALFARMLSPVQMARLTQPALIFAAAGAGLGLLACILWGVLQGAKAPLRHKPLIISSILCVWGMMIGLGFTALKLVLAS